VERGVTVVVIVPDAKDWTWVLEHPCPECGFVASEFVPARVADVSRANAATWVELLAAPDASSRQRADRWSVLEYACHVRDVFRVCDRRLERMLEEDGPHYENWDQDRTAIEDDYSSQDPVVVRAEIVAAADVLARRFETVTGDAWQRPGYRSDGATFTIESFARYVIHDPLHHLWDVGAPSPI
jgi:hypothetical protein